jgi:hypothetical protein
MAHTNVGGLQKEANVEKGVNPTDSNISDSDGKRGNDCIHDGLCDRIGGRISENVCEIATEGAGIAEETGIDASISAHSAQNICVYDHMIPSLQACPVYTKPTAERLALARISHLLVGMSEDELVYFTGHTLTEYTCATDCSDVRTHTSSHKPSQGLFGVSESDGCYIQPFEGCRKVGDVISMDIVYSVIEDMKTTIERAGDDLCEGSQTCRNTLTSSHATESGVDISLTGTQSSTCQPDGLMSVDPTCSDGLMSLDPLDSTWSDARGVICSPADILNPTFGDMHKETETEKAVHTPTSVCMITRANTYMKMYMKMYEGVRDGHARAALDAYMGLHTYMGLHPATNNEATSTLILARVGGHSYAHPVEYLSAELAAERLAVEAFKKEFPGFRNDQTDGMRGWSLGGNHIPPQHWLAPHDMEYFRTHDHDQPRSDGITVPGEGVGYHPTPYMPTCAPSADITRNESTASIVFDPETFGSPAAVPRAPE